VLFLSCACVSVSGVLFSVGVCVCDLLNFLQAYLFLRLPVAQPMDSSFNPLTLNPFHRRPTSSGGGVRVNLRERGLLSRDHTLLFTAGLSIVVCVCVGVGRVVLCRCVCVCDLLIFLQAYLFLRLPVAQPNGSLSLRQTAQTIPWFYWV